MTSDDELIGRLEVYLVEFEGSTPLPDHVREAVRAELPKTRQRPTWWPAGSRFSLSTGVKLAAAAAVVVVATAIGVILLDRQPRVGDANPSVPVPSSQPTTPVEVPATGELRGGTYFIPNPYTDEDPIRSCEDGCADYVRIIFSVPGGWATTDGFVHKHLGQPNEVAFRAWTPDRVYSDPCNWLGGSLDPLIDIHDHSQEPALGSTALVNQLGRNASEPTAAMLGGQSSTRIELSVPSDLNVGTTCDLGEYRSWTEWDVDAANSHHQRGQTDVVYLVDVDRRTLVIDASIGRDTSAGDRAELEAVLASMVIESTEASDPL